MDILICQYPKIYIVFQAKSIIAITTINNTMNEKIVYILNLLKAASMQISIWRWEIHMISNYGFDHGYKDF
jgi:hypothetical protein